MDETKTGGMANRKLKDPRTLRVFFSSPFGGMEEEREELTRKYFPHFHHQCNARGIQFVPVDMRWGITLEAADNAQVINICLREIDRSDVFIGFFGQRYGWHGESDDLLQRNFDNAVGRYPWLNNFRGRSVTELEFLHGHLNHPRNLPACICFRDKAYDDMVKTKAEAAGDKKTVFKYSAESEHSAELMADLIKRVRETESQCLGVLFDYTDPHEGAKFMFESVWQCCMDLLKESGLSELSPLQQNRLCHDAYIASRTSLYLGGESYLETLEQARLKGITHILVRGPSGCGKSALLAKVVDNLRIPSAESPACIYHFVGCAQGTTDPQNILKHILTELQHINTTDITTSGRESYSELSIGEEAKSPEYHEIYVSVQNEMEHAVADRKEIVIIIDGLDKVTAATKTAKPLYWLPEKFPEGIHLIVSTSNKDTMAYDLLVTNRGFHDLEILPLKPDVQEEICKQALQLNGKELSPNQLKRVVDAEQTKSPLFLKIVLSEISIYGYFRLLDKKIDSLIYSDGVTDLLSKVLQRLEEDYNVQDHSGPLVEQVLSALAVSHYGLSETELLDMFCIASHVWSPLYFAIENFLINDAGLLRFAFSELQEAVEARYLSSKEKRLQTKCHLIEYFESIRKDKETPYYLSSMKIQRVARELPWLQKDIGDKQGLICTISDVRVFHALHRISVYELIDFWTETGYTQTQICDALLNAFDVAISNIYIAQEENLFLDTSPAGYILLPALQSMHDTFSIACYHRVDIRVLQRAVEILEGIQGKIAQDVRDTTLRDYRYHLACAYVNNTEYDRAQVLHESVMQECRRLLEDSKDARLIQTLAYTCNGLGVLHVKNKEYEKAESLFLESAKLHQEIGNKLCVAEARMNIGIIELDNGQPEVALEYFTEANKTFEEIYFGHMPVVVGNLLTNMALCHRRMGNTQQAKELYLSSMQVKANAVGWQNEVIATCYMNLGSLEFYSSKDFAKAEEYTKKAIEVLELNEVKLEQNEMWQAQENLVLMLISQNKWEEALPIFRRVYTMLEKENRVDQGAASVHREMIRYMISKGMFQEAASVALSHVKSPKLRQPSVYILLDYCDRHIELKPQRPAEQTVHYALEVLWPGSNELTNYVVQNHVLPAGDIDLFFKMVRTMGDQNPDFTWSTYKAGAIWCENLDRLDVAVLVLKEGLDKYPDSVELKIKLFDVLRLLKNYREAYAYLDVVLESEPDNQALMLIGGQVAFSCEDLDLCMQLWEKVAEMPDKNLAEKARAALANVKAALQEVEAAEEVTEEGTDASASVEENTEQ